MGGAWDRGYLQCTCSSFSCVPITPGEWLVIGDVKGKVATPCNPELVPRDYGTSGTHSDMI